MLIPHIYMWWGVQCFCSSTCNLDASVSQFSKSQHLAPASEANAAISAAASSNGRVMLIDGTSIIYRAYYKLLGILSTLHLLLHRKNLTFSSSGLTVTYI